MGNKRYNTNYKGEYVDTDYDHDEYMQSAIFDMDDTHDNYYSYTHDNNSYITEGNDYFNNSNDYIDDEYSFENSSNYNGYYYDDVYDENFYDDYSQGDNYYNRGYSDVDKFSNFSSNRNYSENVDVYDSGYITDTYNTGHIGSITGSIDNEDIKVQNSGNIKQDRNINYELDYGKNNNYDNKNNAVALKYNNIPTNNIQFEDSFVVSSSMFEDEEEKIISVRDIINLGICVVLAFVLAYLIAMYGIQHTEVEGRAMDFNLKDKDVLIVDKFSYKFGKPKRFDIVEFPYKNTNYIKRIIGLPGETVRVAKDGKIYINGEELKEDIYSYTKSSINGCEDVKLADDEYFVLGDNRNYSDDSRGELGPVKKDDISGKIIFRVYPFIAFGSIDNSINEKIKNGDTDLANDGGFVPDDIEEASK